jgi:hypothetical protein
MVAGILAWIAGMPAIDDEAVRRQLMAWVPEYRPASH